MCHYMFSSIYGVADAVCGWCGGSLCGAGVHCKVHSSSVPGVAVVPCVPAMCRAIVNTSCVGHTNLHMYVVQ